MRSLALALAVFFALTIPASAGDPETVFTNTSWWKQPFGGTPTTLFVSTVANASHPHGVAGIYSEAYSNLNLAQGPADVTAIAGIAYADNPNGYGTGVYAETHAQSANGHGVGAEVRSGNYTASHALYQPYYASRLVGLWLSTAGLDSSAAIQVGNVPPSRWKVGLGFTSGSVADSSIRDDSQSQIALDIRGVHQTAIKVAAGAGKVVLDAPVWLNGKLIELIDCAPGYKCLAVRD